MLWLRCIYRGLQPKLNTKSYTRGEYTDTNNQYSERAYRWSHNENPKLKDNP